MLLHRSIVATATCGERATPVMDAREQADRGVRVSTHLIGGNLHGREAYVDTFQEVVAHLVKEERAPVGAVVALNVQTGRPRFGAEVAAVAQTGQNWLESVVVVVNFLQTQDMRSVAEDLL